MIELPPSDAALMTAPEAPSAKVTAEGLGELATMMRRVQTLLFEDDQEISFQRESILISCDAAGLARREDGSKLWIRTKHYLDRVAETFGTPSWDDCKSPKDLKKLNYAVMLERLGYSSF